MRYIKVNWKHNDKRDPKVIYSELDASLWEKRKVEVFPDGSLGYADNKNEAGGTMLGLEAWPDLKKIAEDPQFELFDISKEEFEKLFSTATNESRKPKLLKWLKNFYK